jgi:hypothetical protein
MIVLGAHHRPDDGVFISQLGQTRQMLANLDSSDIGPDGIELAADFRGRIPLQIEDILMRWSTREEDHNHRFVGAADPGKRLRA